MIYLVNRQYLVSCFTSCQFLKSKKKWGIFFLYCNILNKTDTDCFKNSMSFIFVNKSHMKKTWHMARFEPQSNEMKLFTCKHFPTELAGPGLFLTYNTTSKLSKLMNFNAVDSSFSKYKKVRGHPLMTSRKFRDLLPLSPTINCPFHSGFHT